MGMFGHFGGALTTAMQAAGTSYQVNVTVPATSSYAVPAPATGSMIQSPGEALDRLKVERAQAIEGELARAGKPPTRRAQGEHIDAWLARVEREYQLVFGRPYGAMAGRTKVLLGAAGLGALYFLFKKR